MDRNTIIALVLSFLVLAVWNIWYSARYGEVMEVNRLQALEEAEKKPSVDGAVSLPEKEIKLFDAKESGDGRSVELRPIDPTAAPPAKRGKDGIGRSVSSLEGERLVMVDTGSTEITLSNVGGVIKSWKLTGYKNDEGETIELVTQKPILKPLSLEFASPEATEKINSSIFEIMGSRKITLTESRPTATVAFTHTLDTGFKLDKRITFHYQSYAVDIEIVLSHAGSSVAGSTFAVGWYGFGDNISSIYSYNGPVIMVDGERVAEKPDDDEKETYEGKIEWAGLSNKYYTAAFFPEEMNTKVTTRLATEGAYSTSLRIASAGNGKPIRLALYAGPKIVKDLKDQGRGFQRMINYGWLDIIAKPIYTVLIWIYGITGNFGWAIVIITILVKVIFFPLTQKSFRSMNKIRKIQPQMKILQDRYKNDKTKMNEELIALYKKHKVNPMSGCFPMLLQIPVFIALYKVLLDSIELKGADFIFWLHDLSAKDPYYITPVVMGASMFLQMKLSPQATDPMQKNLMLFMPVIFTVMFVNFPSGLVVYWLVNNLLSIAQQHYVNKEKEA